MTAAKLTRRKRSTIPKAAHAPIKQQHFTISRQLFVLYVTLTAL
jgi:hypothetical protein